MGHNGKKRVKIITLKRSMTAGLVAIHSYLGACHRNFKALTISLFPNLAR